MAIPSSPRARQGSHTSITDVRKTSLTFFAIPQGQASLASSSTSSSFSHIPPSQQQLGLSYPIFPRPTAEASTSSSSSQRSSLAFPSNGQAGADTEQRPPQRLSFGFAGLGTRKGPAQPSGSSSNGQSKQQNVATSPLTATSAVPEQVRCHVVDDTDIWLPFLERPSEVDSLLFQTPCHASLAARLRTWTSRNGQAGQELLRLLTQVDRLEMGDVRWVATIRKILVVEAPELFANLVMALGAEGIPSPEETQKQSRPWMDCDDQTHYDDDAFDDDGSDLSSVASLPGESSRRHSRALSGRAGSVDRLESGSVDFEGLNYLPDEYHRPVSHMQQPSHGSDEEVGTHSNRSKGLQSSWDQGRAPTTFDSRASGVQSSGTSASGSRRMSVALSNEGSYESASQTTGATAFAGLRIQCRSLSHSTSPKSPRKRGPSSAGDSSTATSPLAFKHHRRLSSLMGEGPSRAFATSSTRRPLARHRHQPSIGGDAGPPSNLLAQPNEVTKKEVASVDQSRASAAWDAVRLALLSGGASALQSPESFGKRRSGDLIQARPLAMRSIDDGELLHPQKSKASFARTFEGLTLHDPRHHGRPKAYSMTHYTASRERTRMDRGKEADLTPLDTAIKAEAEGKDKPRDLGVLKDGRTQHPTAGQTESQTALAAFRLSAGITPRVSGGSPSGSPSSSAGSDRDGERTATPSPTRSQTPKFPSPGERQVTVKAKPGTERKDTLRSTGSHTPTESGASLPRQALSATQATPHAITPPRVYRRAGGFDSYSKELEARRRYRARATSDVAFSSGSQAVDSSEGTPLSDYSLSVDSQGSTSSPVVHSPLGRSEREWDQVVRPRDLSTMPSLSGMAEAVLPASAPSSRRGLVGEGELGMSFGEEQEENQEAKFSMPSRRGRSMSDASIASSSSMSSSDESGLSRSGVLPEATSPPRPDLQGRSRSALETSPNSPSAAAAAHLVEGTHLSARGLRKMDHIIIPIAPGHHQSRSQALSIWLKGSETEDLRHQMPQAIGTDRWNQAVQIMTTRDRREVRDQTLLEQLAMGPFGLVDLIQADPHKRAAAEQILCEDLEGYQKRWEGFELLLEQLGVPRGTIGEAERRCGPGQMLG